MGDNSWLSHTVLNLYYDIYQGKITYQNILNIIDTQEFELKKYFFMTVRSVDIFLKFFRKAKR